MYRSKRFLVGGGFLLVMWFLMFKALAHAACPDLPNHLYGPYRWRANEVDPPGLPFYVNSSYLVSAVSPNLTSDATYAANTWSNATYGSAPIPFDLWYVSDTSRRAYRYWNGSQYVQGWDGYNVISYQDDLEPGVVARAHPKSYGAINPQRLMECDIGLNYWYFTFQTHGGFFYGYEYCLRDTLTHEFGHWVNLKDLYPKTNPPPGKSGCDEYQPYTMYYISPPNTHIREDLYDGDIIGLNYMYNVFPSPAPPIPFHPIEEMPISAEIPTSVVVGQSFPNPGNPEIWIPYTLSQYAEVQIIIYNANGERVRTLKLGEQPPGKYLTKAHAAHWDGKNKYGEEVTSGIYFYVFEAGDYRAAKKLVISR
ncbi:T9SS type A sorting domain-containing protein [Candidatus Poribacteria bacterium]|nr:T9SS type A sorting domain-containing protein [Candidatus Poribacteria bacterium]